MTNNPLRDAENLGQFIWLDNLSRTLLATGELDRLIAEDGLSGITSNPAIFQKAIAESPYYQDDLAKLKSGSLSPEARYEALAIADIQAACDKLRPVFDRTSGSTGYVSLEVSPHLAHDTSATLAAARDLHGRVGRDNLLVKVPATTAGIQAFEELIAEGINVNVTLMFSLRHQESVACAYMRGARRWVKKGGNPKRLKSVASLFMSRVDTLVDKKLDAIGTSEALALRGLSAVTLGKLAYQQYLALFHSTCFADLEGAGVRPQFPLWASTGVKNPAYRDVLYLEPLIGPETINTLPDATLAAFRDHGIAASTITEGAEAAQRQVENLASFGIDLNEIGEQLQTEGITLFVQAYDKLLDSMR